MGHQLVAAWHKMLYAITECALQKFVAAPVPVGILGAWLATTQVMMVTRVLTQSSSLVLDYVVVVGMSVVLILL